MAAPAQRHTTDPAPMTLLLLEALGALIILVLIVWWTMFSGRPNGELPPGEGAGEMAGDLGEDKK
jgi:hypothetical protein